MTTKARIEKVIDEINDEYKETHCIGLRWEVHYHKKIREYRVCIYIDYPLCDYVHFHFWQFRPFRKNDNEDIELKKAVSEQINTLIKKGAEKYGYGRR